MLKYNEFVPYAPSNTGVIRVNHESDTCRGDSKSMRIERKSDGSIHAKCFRCGAYGVDSRSIGTLERIKSGIGTDKVTSNKDKEDSLGKVLYRPEEWPVKAYIWLRRYGIESDEIINYGIGYSEGKRRVILPIWWQGKKQGFQLRRIFDDDTGPKYITYAKGGVGFMSFGCEPSDRVVLVEDIISAIKVGRQEQAVALLSTGVTQQMKLAFSSYNTFYIWLDMDNAQVVRSAVNLLKSLGIYGVTKLLHTPKDPKEYTDKEITRFLYAA